MQSVKGSESGQDISPESSELSNVLMFKFIKDSMVRLEEEVCVMAETLEALVQDSTKVQGQEMI